MQSVRVAVTSLHGDYFLHAGPRLLTEVSLFAPFIQKKSVFILTHSQIARYYLPSLTATLQEAGARQIDYLYIPAGEEHKNIATASEIWSTLSTSYHHRDSVMVTLGGGMIGDLGGFSAACFMRGMKLIHCPTSLLAQVDAAIGGKTAINHVTGKNLIGVIYPPQLVVADTSTLETLPEREFKAGLAELIKCGMALDATFFSWLQQSAFALLAGEPQTLLQAVSWGAQLKAKIVSHDEQEKGQRIFLNFGHTVAHALESLLDYKEWLHGEAVAVGMVVATQLSLQRGWIEAKLLDNLISLLSVMGLPTKLPSKITVAEILAKIRQDKKHAHQRLQWVLLRNLGEAHISIDVTPQQVATALQQCGAIA